MSKNGPIRPSVVALSPLRRLAWFAACFGRGESTLASLDLAQHAYKARFHHVELVHHVLISFGPQFTGGFLGFGSDVACPLAGSNHDCLIIEPHAGFTMGIFDDAPGLDARLRQDSLTFIGSSLAVTLLVGQC